MPKVPALRAAGESALTYKDAPQIGGTMNAPIRSILKTYFAIAFGIITPLCILVVFLSRRGLFQMGSVVWILTFVAGGLSTAIAGIVTGKKYGKFQHPGELFRDFFAFKQPLLPYFVITGFLIAQFLPRILQEQFLPDRRWLDLPVLFLAAILLGGVEEIGWRYILGPTLERRLPFAVSTALVAVFWGIWHIMFFVLAGSLQGMHPLEIVLFLFGLIGVSFVLAAIYHITKSLWLCVFYHALFNALSQTFVPISGFGTTAIAIVSILLSLLAVYLYNSRVKRIGTPSP